MKTVLAVACCLPLVLTGCSLSNTAAPMPDAGLAIQGSVHGGNLPVTGAHVYMFAANAGTAAGPGIAASNTLPNSNASSSLLSASFTGHSDSIGAYVLTDSNGNFTIGNAITSDYSCVPNAQVYLYALGGNPGLAPGTNNSALGLLAVLGSCPSTGNFVTQTPYIVINEVSTVAAAYAFAGYASDATHVSSSGSALALTGIQNAFANAASLDTLSTGLAPATTPLGGGIVPQQTIYALADILASCVNTDGTITGGLTPTPCYTLVNNALSAGTSGSVPSDTATAAINIAHNPGANVANLSGLVSANVAFSTSLALPPNDFTLGLQFTGGGVNTPNAIAIDASGNAWMTNGNSSVTKLASSGDPASTSTGYTDSSMDGLVGIAIDLTGKAWIANDLSATTGSVIELSSTGSVLSGTNGITVGGVAVPSSVAIDGSGNVWVPNSNNNTVAELTSGGAAATHSPFSGISLNDPLSVAIDGSENVWIANNGSNTVTELSNSGAATTLSPYSGSMDSPYGIAIDHAGDAWITNSGGASVTELNSAGSPVSGSPYSISLNQPQAIAIDGSGNAWAANLLGGSVTVLNGSGTVLSGSNGYGYNDGSIDLPDAVAIDGSGNVWIGNLSGSGSAVNGSITELIGAATPVVTPLAVGVKNNTLGTRP